MPLVEVVKGLTTGDKTIERARRFCRQLGKETIVVADRPGFATSRLSATIGNEAWYMFMEGVASPKRSTRRSNSPSASRWGPSNSAI